MSETIALPESELILPPGMKTVTPEEAEQQPEQVKPRKYHSQQAGSYCVF